MSIHHIVDAGYVVIEPLVDPLEQPTWLPAASNDLLAYATPIIGPLSTLIVHRMAWYFASGDNWRIRSRNAQHKRCSSAGPFSVPQRAALKLC